MSSKVVESQVKVDEMEEQLARVVEENKRLQTEANTFDEKYTNLQRESQVKERMLQGCEEGFAALRTLHAKTLLELDRTKEKLQRQDERVAEQNHRLKVRLWNVCMNACSDGASMC